MPSKFGGIPVDEKSAGGSKFGGVPVEDEQAPINLNPGSSSDAVGRFAGNMASAMNPIPGIRAIATDPAGLKHGIEENVFRPQMDQFGKAADAAQGKGEFEGMGPIGRASEAFGHGLAGALPLVGPSAANAGDQIGSGDVAGGLGSAAGLLATTGVPTDNPLKAFKTGSVRSIGLPDAVQATGRGLRKVAEFPMETGLGIRNVDRVNGKAPGRVALDETTGFSPGAVKRSGTLRMGDLKSQKGQILSSSNATPSLRPALTDANDAISAARAGNSDTSHLEPMQDQLTNPKPGFAGATTQTAPGAPLTISELQNPANFDSIRARFGKDFTKFDHARPLSNEALATGNKVYHQLSSELHRAVPEVADTDRTLSSLGPVVAGAGAKSLEASPWQQVAHKLVTPTGALVGAAYGHSIGGIPGMIAGGVLPTLLGSPEAQIATARGLNATGGAVAHPVTGRLIQGAQNTKPLRRKEEE